MDVKEEQHFGHILDEHWYYKSKGLALDEMLRGLSFHTALDIGAGSGVFSKRLLRQNVAAAVCVDPAYAQEDRLENFHGKPIRFVREIGPERADLVLLMDVLEHVDDDLALLRSATAGAASKAHVLITVPAFQCLFSAHDKFLEHKQRYTLRQVEALVRAAGLNILSTRYFFAFLLPLAAALRIMQRHDEPKSSLKAHSILVNKAMYWIHRLEILLFRYNRLAGLSIFCLAQKS